MPESIPSLRWSLSESVHIAYSTVTDGDQRDPAKRAAWMSVLGINRPVVVPVQVHGTSIVQVPATPSQLARADGVATTSNQVVLGVFGADCPGVCLVASDAMAVAHCGWRGTAAGIVGLLIKALEASTAQPRDRWRAFIGPGISGPCYEVDAAVIDARPWPPAALVPSRPGHAHLDLRTAIASDLRGMDVQHIMTTPVCTALDARLWSYRRRGPGIVQMLIIWRDV